MESGDWNTPWNCPSFQPFFRRTSPLTLAADLAVMAVYLIHLKPCCECIESYGDLFCLFALIASIMNIINKTETQLIELDREAIAATK